MSSEITEALTALGANALVQKVISPVLAEVVQRYSPFVSAIPTDPWTSNIYYFNTRNALPAGGFVGDGGARPVSTSNYIQSQFQIRNLQTVGSVTGYAQAVTRGQIGDLLRTEMQGATQGLVWDIETGIDWGCAAATANTWAQYDGLDVIAAQFNSALPYQNALDAGGNLLTLGYLDQLVDMVEENAAMPIIGDDWMFVMSPRARSTFTQALIPQQRFLNGGSDNGVIAIAPGFNVPSYRGIPIVPSSFLSSRGTPMPAVTTTPSTTGGTLVATTYYYRVSAVIGRWGELNACAEVTAATTGSTGSVLLSFTPPAAIDGSSVQSYRVFRSTATTTETLIGIVDAVVVLGSDGITPTMATSILDTGTALIPQNGGTQPAVLPTAYFNANTGVLPRTTTSAGNYGGEDIYLISRNKNNVVRPYVRDMQPVPLAATTTSPDVLPFALVADTCFAVRIPRYVGRLRNIVATLNNNNPTQNTHAIS